jgi:hypothetical protein
MVIGLIVVLCVSCVSVGSAAEIKDTHLLRLSKIKYVPHDTPFKHPVKTMLSVNYTEQKYSTDAVEVVKQVIGLTPLTDDTNVAIKGHSVANLPADSKFKDIVVHESCLSYQYGTDKWYKCEEKLL